MAPNIIFIISDNQSPWTLGCYGNTEILTPNIDRLAGQGVRFTSSFCVNPVCSPNRATLLTGLMPSQHGVHNWLGTEKPDAQMGPDAYSTIAEFPNLAQILAEEGYDCGMSGKWHLGDSVHKQLGFRYWFSKPRGNTEHFYDSEAIWQGEVYKEPRYYTDAITDHAIDFLKQDRGEAPFFLYLGYNGPYGLDADALVGHQNKFTDYYADKELSCFPRQGMDHRLKEYRQYVNNPTAFRSYACAVSGVDDGVGQILQEVDAQGIAEDTIVVFTSDHGLCGGHHGFWGMGDHSRPMHMFQENMQVPLIWRHPKRVPPGRVTDTMVCNYDFLPSMLSYLGLGNRLEKSRPLPGRDFSSALVSAETLHFEPDAVYHEYENTRSVQTRRWKLISRHPNGPDEFYDLAEDPAECHNLINDQNITEFKANMHRMLEDFFKDHVDPKYDLWQGGTTKAGMQLKDFEKNL